MNNYFWAQISRASQKRSENIANSFWHMIRVHFPSVLENGKFIFFMESKNVPNYCPRLYMYKDTQYSLPKDFSFQKSKAFST